VATPAEIVAACDTQILALVARAKQLTDADGRAQVNRDLKELRETRAYYQRLVDGADSSTLGIRRRTVKHGGPR